MTEVLYLTEFDEQLRKDLESSVQQWRQEVAELLASLPADIEIEFDNEYLLTDHGTGGVAWSRRKMKLAYDPTFDSSKEDLEMELKQSFYHEAYHLARDYSYETTPPDLPALADAVEEGLATKFEMVHAGSKPGYSKYEDRGTMLDWLEEVRGLPDGFDHDWQRWKFYDPETGRQWILYKLGLFIVDEALRNNPDLTIESMAKLDIVTILKLSRL